MDLYIKSNNLTFTCKLTDTEHWVSIYGETVSTAVSFIQFEPVSVSVYIQAVILCALVLGA